MENRFIHAIDMHTYNIELTGDCFKNLNHHSTAEFREDICSCKTALVLGNIIMFQPRIQCHNQSPILCLKGRCVEFVHLLHSVIDPLSPVHIEGATGASRLHKPQRARTQGTVVGHPQIFIYCIHIFTLLKSGYFRIKCTSDIRTVGPRAGQDLDG